MDKYNVGNEFQIVDRIPALLEKFLTDDGGIGATAAVLEYGNLTFFAKGKMSIERDDPVTEDTVFEIGSISKVFTAIVMSDLEEKGMLRLDDPVDKYIPINAPTFNGEKITIRHLTTHTAGFPRMSNCTRSSDPFEEYKNYTVECLYDFLQSYTLTRRPGALYDYSNVGVALLGHILSLRTGKSYDHLVRDVITKVLDMPNTSSELSDRMAENFAAGHNIRRTTDYMNLTTGPMDGAGGIRSDIKDMAAFLVANVEAANMDVEDTYVNVRTLMKRCQTCDFHMAPNSCIGRGWHTNYDVVWHNGGTIGFSTFIGFDAKRKRGVVILTNSRDSWSTETGMFLLDNPNYKGQPVVDESLANDSAYLESFVGLYVLNSTSSNSSVLFSNDQVRIQVLGKRLLLGDPGDLSFVRLYPESRNVFGFAPYFSLPIKVHFVFDEQVPRRVAKMEGRLISNGTVTWEAIPI